MKHKQWERLTKTKIKFFRGKWNFAWDTLKRFVKSGVSGSGGCTSSILRIQQQGNKSKWNASRFRGTKKPNRPMRVKRWSWWEGRGIVDGQTRCQLTWSIQVKYTDTRTDKCIDWGHTFNLKVIHSFVVVRPWCSRLWVDGKKRTRDEQAGRGSYEVTDDGPQFQLFQKWPK